jgi:hypothetical protein
MAAMHTTALQSIAIRVTGPTLGHCCREISADVVSIAQVTQQTQMKLRCMGLETGPSGVYHAAAAHLALQPALTVHLAIQLAV